MVTLEKRLTHPLLQDKLAHLGLVLICANLQYNPFNDLPHVDMRVTHTHRPYWEKRCSPREDKDEYLVELVHIPTEDNREPWHKFYFIVAKANENFKMGTTMYNKLRYTEEWTLEKMRAFWVYR